MTVTVGTFNVNNLFSRFNFQAEVDELPSQFNRDMLGGLYPHVALVEGNDPRLIDVGLLSKLPIGAITSHQAVVHPDAPG